MSPKLRNNNGSRNGSVPEILKKVSAENKRKINSKIKSVRTHLEKLTKKERDIEETRIALGKEGKALRDLLEELPKKQRPRVKPFFKKVFGVESARVFEAMAALHAVEMGVDPSVGITTLTMLGQAVNSNSDSKKTIAEKIIEDGCLTFENGESLKIIEAQAKDIRKALKGSKTLSGNSNGKSESSKSGSRPRDLPEVKLTLKSVLSVFRGMSKKKRKDIKQKFGAKEISEIQKLANDILNEVLTLMGGDKLLKPKSRTTYEEE